MRSVKVCVCSIPEPWLDRCLRMQEDISLFSAHHVPHGAALHHSEHSFIQPEQQTHSLIQHHRTELDSRHWTKCQR